MLYLLYEGLKLKTTNLLGLRNTLILIIHGPLGKCSALIGSDNAFIL